MDDQEIRDAKDRLGSLSARQREILGMVCQGMLYTEIADKLVISENTVKAHMKQVYRKLGLADIKSQAQRGQQLHGLYCPRLAEANLPPPAPEPEKPEPVPLDPKIDQMVEEDQQAITLWHPQAVVPVVPKPESFVITNRSLVGTKPPHPARWLTCGVIIGTTLTLIVVGLGLLGLSELGVGVLVLSSPTPQIQVVEVLITGTPAPTQPSMTPVVQTVVVLITTTPPPATATPPPQTDTPEPSPTPTPVIELPFTDDFNSGPSPLWTPLGGDWVTSDGSYTLLIQDAYAWYWALLDVPELKDYRVTIKIFVPNLGAASQQDIAIAVRVSKDQTRFVGFTCDTLKRCGWGLLGKNPNDVEFIAGKKGDMPATGVYQIEVIGNEFIASINGREWQRITIPGYEQGGIALGSTCGSFSGCPRFDDFTVEAVNP